MIKSLKFVIVLLIGLTLDVKAGEVLTALHIKNYKDGAESFVKDYYDDISMLCDLNLTYSERKDITLAFINERYDGDDSKMIGNDLQATGLNKAFYSIREYVQMLTQTKNEIEITPENITVSELYKNAANQYVLMVSFDRTLLVLPTDGSKSAENRTKVMMLLEPLKKKGGYKVIDFGLAKNADNPLKSYVLVTPSADVTENKVDSQTPSFLPEIYPAKAVLFIDGEETEFLNGLQIPTSPGYHDIKVEAEGYEPRNLKKLIGNTGKFALKIDLEKEKGYLYLYVGNEFLRGEPVVIINERTKKEIRKVLPVTGLELEQGTYRIRVMGAKVANPGNDKVSIISGVDKNFTVSRVSKEVRGNRMDVTKKIGGKVWDILTKPAETK